MSTATSATTGVAGRYASALFELADTAKSLDQVAQDLSTFRKLVGESPDLARLIASPVIGRDLQGKALLAVLDAAGITGLTRNFIGTVAGNGRARELVAMATAFLAELASRRGETTVAVTSAVALSPAHSSRLANLARISGVSDWNRRTSAINSRARARSLRARATSARANRTRLLRGLMRSVASAIRSMPA